MSEMSFQKTDVLKLARAYVALALAKDEAKRYVRKHSAQPGFLTILTSLDISAGLLEEILEHAIPEKDPARDLPSITCSDMLM